MIGNIQREIQTGQKVREGEAGQYRKKGRRGKGNNYENIGEEKCDKNRHKGEFAVNYPKLIIFVENRTYKKRIMRIPSPV